MNINDHVLIPGIIETRADALAVLCKHQIGAIVYHATLATGGITQVLIRGIQFTVGSNGSMSIRYTGVDPRRPGLTPTWYEVESQLHSTLADATTSIWCVSPKMF